MSPVVVHLTGNPGSGKGTQSELLIERLGFTHFSVGQLMRDEVATGSELGKQLEMINHGKIAPPELTMAVIKKHVTNPAYKYIVLDGFPRTIEQAEIYNRIVGPAQLTLVFDLKDEECVKRLKHRGLTSNRQDDNDAAIKTRFEQFYAKTAPAIEYLKTKVHYMDVDCSPSIEEVYKLVEKAVRSVM